MELIRETRNVAVLLSRHVDIPWDELEDSAEKEMFEDALLDCADMACEIEQTIMHILETTDESTEHRQSSLDFFRRQLLQVYVLEEVGEKYFKICDAIA